MDMTQSFPVSLARCPSYASFRDEYILDSLLTSLEGLPSFRGKHVLLKPNLVSGRAPLYGCTDSRFIRTVSLWLLAQGARVRLGDSPAFGSARSVCEKMGICDQIRDLDVAIVEFDRSVKVSLDCGISVKVAAEALECDVLINLPKIKAHSQMYVTLAVKNCFGIVTGMQKALLHMRHGTGYKDFSKLILDLQKIIPQQIIIGDGIEVMHRKGPISGDLFLLGCVGASTDAVAFDTAMLDVLGLDAHKSPLWQQADAENMRASNLRNIPFPLCTPSDFADCGFCSSENLSPVRFNPFRFFSGMLRRMAHGGKS